MKNQFAMAATFVLFGVFNLASAGEFGDLKNNISAARVALVDMTIHKDKRGAEQQKLVRDTADAVSVQLAKMKAPAGKTAQFNELVETWKAFKETREKELVPAILMGEEKKASTIAAGIQKQRLATCMSLISELGD